MNEEMKKKFSKVIVTNEREMNEDMKKKFSKVIEETKRKLNATPVRENFNLKEESYLIEELCLKFKRRLNEYANKISKKLDAQYNYDDVINIFRRLKINDQKERVDILYWAQEVITHLKKALNGDEKSFEKFDELRRTYSFQSYRNQNIYNRILVIMLYNKIDGFKEIKNREKLYYFGNAIAAYHFYDIVDIISENYGYTQKYKKKRNTDSRRVNGRRRFDKDAERQIEKLEEQLERKEEMLKDLQDEFEEQLEESKNLERMKFFSNLNSEKYGRILDELIQNQKGVNKLRRENAEIPIELNGILIIFKKLVQFIRDNEIEPILKVGSIKEVRANEINHFNYEGTPFEGDEYKKVKVVSSGWVYKKNDIQIARPIVKEVGIDD